MRIGEAPDHQRIKRWIMPNLVAACAREGHIWDRLGRGETFAIRADVGGKPKLAARGQSPTFLPEKMF
ncbi:MAG: hypothetical protein AB1918_00595 [Pseudomonadota bacterium]